MPSEKDSAPEAPKPNIVPIPGSPAAAPMEVVIPMPLAGMPTELREELTGMFAHEEGAKPPSSAPSTNNAPWNAIGDGQDWNPPGNIPQAVAPINQTVDMSKILRSKEKGKVNIKVKYIDPKVEVLDIATKEGRDRYNEITKLIADNPGKIAFYETEAPPHFMPGTLVPFHVIVVLKWCHLEYEVERPEAATVVGEEQRVT